MFRVSVIVLAIGIGITGCSTLGSRDARFAAAYQEPYRLDTGDRLRVIVFGQENLTNSYTVDPEGQIAFPLIGQVPVRGLTLDEFDHSVTSRLRSGYLRDPNVTVEIAAYRPFFILGEVGASGQYPYVDDITAREAIAIAGGFTPRARRGKVRISRQINGHIVEEVVPIDAPILPGDTVTVLERWF